MAIRIARTGVALTVGIILLAGLVTGGLFIVKNSGEQARREQAIATAEENLDSQSNGEVALNEGDDSGTNESTGGSSDSSSDTESTSGSTASGSTSSSSELPQTGPHDGLLFLLIGVITYLGAYYYQARRA